MGGTEAARLAETQRAFDSVAADYDGPRGNNALIQRMRRTLWDVVDREVPAGAPLLDLGCGTGLDAHRFAQSGHPVVATDWSPAMVARTRTRLADGSLAVPVEARQLGIHELAGLDASFDGRFGGIYSNFGPMNCVPDLGGAAAQCARLLRPGGVLVFSVMGRLCPWELGHYALRRRFRRARSRPPWRGCCARPAASDGRHAISTSRSRTKKSMTPTRIRIVYLMT
jgi:SAM-dependent methyltransferase